MSRLGIVAVVGVVLALAAGPAFAQDAKPFVLSSFEPGGANFVAGGRVVAEHATEGKNACLLETTPDGYVGIEITGPAALAKFKDYVVLKMDVYNPQSRVVQFGVRVDDAKSTSYGTRYNDDGAAAAPGKSTFELNLTGLTRSQARNFLEREKLDLPSLKLATFFLGPNPDKLKLYIDNVRLEGSGLPKVEGLRAFDFGPEKSAIYPGFEGASEQSTWAPARGFGWVNPAVARRLFSPDDLGCDFVAGDEFRVALPNGSYEVNLGIDVVGEWHAPYFWRERTLTLNGKQVLRETQTAKEFMDKVYYRHEDEEDLPGEDVWEKFVAPVNQVRRFPVEVTDGMLRVALKSDRPEGQAMTFLVVYPAAKQVGGRLWMELLDRIRRERFKNAMALDTPKAPAGVPALARGRGLGYVLFVRHTEKDIPVTATPAQAEIEKDVVMQAAQGEREHAQLGIAPITDQPMTIAVTVSDLRGPNGAVIPASAVKLRKVRNFLKRMGGTSEGQFLPYLLQDFDTLDLKPGVTRGVWLTVSVPDTAVPGEYHGDVSFAAKGQAVSAAKSVTLTVFPFKLEPAKTISLSSSGTTAGHWRAAFPELEDEWWRRAEIVMKDLADHGMNAVTGGPGATLRGIKDGKADIDYADMDRWLALAVKYGLTMPGDSYQGLSINGVPHNMSRDCVRIVEEESQKRFGLPYKDVIRIVYADVEQHAKEKGWPKRVYYLLDEPRREYGNVEPCLELIKIVTAAAPDTLFSGYYSEGEGRDAYFGIMPVSIAHVTDHTLRLTKEAGKSLWCYDGNRARHNIGRWAFAMAQKGLKGYIRNGYAYTNCDPYFDFTEDEGSWAAVYPSRKGLVATVGWERTGQGTTDFRYLEMLDALSKEGRATNKAPIVAEACRACRLVDKVTDAAKVDDTGSARLTGEEYDAFKRDAAELIVSLRKMLDKK